MTVGDESITEYSTMPDALLYKFHFYINYLVYVYIEIANNFLFKKRMGLGSENLKTKTLLKLRRSKN